MAEAKKLLLLPGDGIGPEVMRETRRLLASPRAREGYLHFASQWLELDHLGSVTKHAMTFPLWSPAVSTAARSEVEAFVADTYSGGRGYSALLTAKDTTAGAADVDSYLADRFTRAG